MWLFVPSVLTLPAESPVIHALKKRDIYFNCHKSTLSLFFHRYTCRCVCLLVYLYSFYLRILIFGLKVKQCTTSLIFPDIYFPHPPWPPMTRVGHVTTARDPLPTVRACADRLMPRVQLVRRTLDTCLFHFSHRLWRAGQRYQDDGAWPRGQVRTHVSKTWSMFASIAKTWSNR